MRERDKRETKRDKEIQRDRVREAQKGYISGKEERPDIEPQRSIDMLLCAFACDIR